MEAASTRQFPCGSCGAPTLFAPGTRCMRCPYCGHENQIPGDDAPPAAGAENAPAQGCGGEAHSHPAAGVDELAFDAYVQLTRAQAHEAAPGTEIAAEIVHCRGCGADVTLPEDAAADFCPYCAQPVVAADAVKAMIRVQAVLPFKIDRDGAMAAWRGWLSRLWFAPGAFKRQTGSKSALAGIYLPYWTYDSHTHSDYVGQRGEYYYVPVSYTTRVNGKTVTRTRMERRTRWYPATGAVERFFDDVLVPASRLGPEELLDRLEPWDLPALEAYRPEFLSGFRAEKYQVGLEEGFARARARMDGLIRGDVAAAIGGDTQRIHSIDTTHSGVTFKHVLLPVWTSASRFGGKVYHFHVNARTGEVIGERPWSAWKIALASLAAAGVVAAALWWLGLPG